MSTSTSAAVDDATRFDKTARLTERLTPEIQAFRDSFQTMQLASISEQGLPHASYAPFAYHQQAFYVLLSDLAQHGQNLKHHSKVGLMLIEDESAAKSIFARKRLSFDSQAQAIDKQSDEGRLAIEIMAARLGEMAANLSQLGDFTLYRLTPKAGRYVKGFGQAFELQGTDQLKISHLTDGHIQKS